MTSKTEQDLKKEIEKIKEAQEVFRKEPKVRGGMTDNPNVEDVKKWKEWYKGYAPFRKQNLDSDVTEAKLFGYHLARKEMSEKLREIKEGSKKSGISQTHVDIDWLLEELE